MQKKQVYPPVYIRVQGTLGSPRNVEMISHRGNGSLCKRALFIPRSSRSFWCNSRRVSLYSLSTATGGASTFNPFPPLTTENSLVSRRCITPWTSWILVSIYSRAINVVPNLVAPLIQFYRWHAIYIKNYWSSHFPPGVPRLCGMCSSPLQADGNAISKLRNGCQVHPPDPVHDAIVVVAHRDFRSLCC
jgi:hypothetical protein